MRLADGAFNYHMHSRKGFEMLVNLVEACSCYEFGYGELESATKTLSNLG